MDNTDRAKSILRGPMTYQRVLDAVVGLLDTKDAEWNATMEALVFALTGQEVSEPSCFAAMQAVTIPMTVQHDE